MVLDDQVQEVIVQGRRDEHWTLFKYKFRPTREAFAAYEAHTKRKMTGQELEEVTLFFRTHSTTGQPLRAERGLLHAVLPTKLESGTSANFQAGWLLSVDRQSLQSISENEWNLCCLRQYDPLFVLLLRWISENADRASSADVKAGFEILPAAGFARKGSKLIWDVFDVTLTMGSLQRAIMEDPLLPMWAPSTVAPGQRVVKFAAGQDLLCIPPALWKIPFCFLEQWFRPNGDRDRQRLLATDLLPTSVLWDNVRVPGRALLKGMEAAAPGLIERCRNDLSDDKMIDIAVDVLAAMMEFVHAGNAAAKAKEEKAAKAGPAAYTTSGSDSKAKSAGGSGGSGRHSSKSKQQKLQQQQQKQQQQKQQQQPLQPQMPAVDYWPVYLTDTWGMAPATGLCWPDRDFYLLPHSVQDILQKYNRSGSFLNSKLHALLNAAPTRSGPRFMAKKFIEHQHTAAEASRSTVSTTKMTERVFAAIAATPSPILPSLVSSVIALTEYAFRSARPELVTHILVGADAARLELITCKQASIGAAFGNAALENAAGTQLRYASAIYVGQTSSISMIRKMSSFLESCGAAVSISFEIINDGRPQREDLLAFSDKKLPGTRSTNKMVDLPYSLSGTLSRKQHLMIDAKLARTWSSLLRATLENQDDAARFGQARGFLELLSQCNFEHVLTCTKDNVPALSAAIKGQTASERDGQHDVPSRRRCIWLPGGEPGAAVQDCGPASWVSTLLKLNWVPVEGGRLVSTARATLTRDPKKPYLQPVDANHGVAVAIVRSGLGDVLKFGTAPPPSPFERLKEVALVNGTPFSTLVGAWIDLLRSIRDGTPCTANERVALKKIVHERGLPGQTSGGFSPGQCVDQRRLWGTAATANVALARQGEAAATSAEEEKGDANAKAMRLWKRVGWLVHVADPQFVLCEYAAELRGLITMPREPDVAATKLYMEWASSSRSTLSEFENDAFTLAMHFSLRHNGGSRTRQTPIQYLFQGVGWSTLAKVDKIPIMCDDPAKWTMVSRFPDVPLIPMHVFGHSGGFLKLLDSSILKALRVKRLSSDEFRLTVKKVGHVTVDNEATRMVTVVMSLLGAAWGSIEVSRCKRIERKLTVPGVDKDKSTITVENFASWERKPGGQHRDVAIHVCGAAIDFATDLQECVLLQAATSRRQDELVRNHRILGLLYHIDSVKSFVTAIKRSFGDAHKDLLAQHELVPVEPAVGIDRPTALDAVAAASADALRKRKERSPAEDATGGARVASKAARPAGSPPPPPPPPGPPPAGPPPLFTTTAPASSQSQPDGLPEPPPQQVDDIFGALRAAKESAAAHAPPGPPPGPLPDAAPAPWGAATGETIRKRVVDTTGNGDERTAKLARTGSTRALQPGGASLGAPPAAPPSGPPPGDLPKSAGPHEGAVARRLIAGIDAPVALVRGGSAVQVAELFKQLTGETVFMQKNKLFTLPDMLTAWKQDALFVVQTEGDRTALAGCCVLAASGLPMLVWVTPSYRLQGIGTFVASHFIDAVAKAARMCDPAAKLALVSPTSIEKFWTRLGFVRHSVKKASNGKGEMSALLLEVAGWKKA